MDPSLFLFPKEYTCNYKTYSLIQKKCYSVCMWILFDINQTEIWKNKTRALFAVSIYILIILLGELIFLITTAAVPITVEIVM